MPEAIAFAADYDGLLFAVGRYLRWAKRERGLIGIVIAHPQRKFAADNILPMIPYWHYRSDQSMLFVFPGFIGDPDAIGDEHFDVPSSHPHFSEPAFVEVIDVFERNSSFEFTGRTSLLLVVGVRQKNDPRAELDFSAVMDFDIEEVISKKFAADAGVVFEQVIRAAKELQADDALWGASQTLKGDLVQEGVLQLVEKYLPIPSGVKESVRKSVAFRVSDRRR